MDASSGFSISIVPPHLAHRVFARGRSPSFSSSNLYLAWQLGQTMIIAFVSPPSAPATGPGGGREGILGRPVPIIQPAADAHRVRAARLESMERRLLVDSTRGGAVNGNLVRWAGDDDPEDDDAISSEDYSDTEIDAEDSDEEEEDEDDLEDDDEEDEDDDDEDDEDDDDEDEDDVEEDEEEDATEDEWDDDDDDEDEDEEEE
jgi:hypothetical protein